MLYLVRHGQTDWNLFKRCNGATDTYLNKTGIEQAKLLSENLRNVNFNSCFCSPQTRARQYCEIIYNGSIVFDDRLAEIICGEFESMEESPEMMKSFWEAVKTGDRGTESIGRFIKRNSDFCDMIVKDHEAENVLIVTHAANTRMINYYFTGKPKDYNFSKAVSEIGGLLTFEI